MIRNTTLSPNSPDLELASSVEDLKTTYQSIGRQLDLFTSRETDSNALFSLADEIEVGLIVLFAALECDLQDASSGRPAAHRAMAERLQEASRWLEIQEAQLRRNHGAPRLADLLEALSYQCLELSTRLWWEWLAKVGKVPSIQPIQSHRQKFAGHSGSHSPSELV